MAETLKEISSGLEKKILCQPRDLLKPGLNPYLSQKLFKRRPARSTVSPSAAHPLWEEFVQSVGRRGIVHKSINSTLGKKKAIESIASYLELTFLAVSAQLPLLVKAAVKNSFSTLHLVSRQ